jgi:hypothetical protein
MLLFLLAALLGCSGPTPPPDAPEDVYYKGGKTPYWRHCAVNSSDQKVHCRIWIKHKLHMDEVFVPYDGGPTPLPEELIPFPSAMNPDIWVVLENGRILIPVSQYEWSKELLEGELADMVDEHGYIDPELRSAD